MVDYVELYLENYSDGLKINKEMATVLYTLSLIIYAIIILLLIDKIDL